MCGLRKYLSQTIPSPELTREKKPRPAAAKGREKEEGALHRFSDDLDARWTSVELPTIALKEDGRVFI